MDDNDGESSMGGVGDETLVNGSGVSRIPGVKYSKLPTNAADEDDSDDDTEQDPLDDRPEWMKNARQGQATTISSVSNLANTIIGSGALAFPSAFASMGMLPGVIRWVKRPSRVTMCRVNNPPLHLLTAVFSAPLLQHSVCIYSLDVLLKSVDHPTSHHQTPRPQPPAPSNPLMERPSKDRLRNKSNQPPLGQQLGIRASTPKLKHRSIR